MHYNPFAYIHSEKDILKLVTALIANTKGEGKAGDEFWTKAETLLYCALIGYIHYEAPENEQNFITLLEMLNAMQVREDDEDYESPVDLMFKALEERDPDHFAVRQYQRFKQGAGKTLKSVLISCGARLAPFDIAELREITSYDELELDTLGDRRTALFLIMSDTDPTFNFLISLVYTQMFNLLCEKADDVYGGRLPVHVRCLIDEMANGTFDVASKTVFINAAYMKEAPDYEKAFYLFHELRHASQYLCPKRFSKAVNRSIQYVILFDGTCYKIVNGKYYECKLEGGEDYFTNDVGSRLSIFTILYAKWFEDIPQRQFRYEIKCNCDDDISDFTSRLYHRHVQSV